MGNIFMIAKNNMKKQKGDMITFLIMMFLTSFLLFNCVSLITGVKKVYEDKFEETNAPDILILLFRSEKASECMNRALKDVGIKEFEKTPILYVSADYGKKDSGKLTNYPFVIENSENKNKILDVFPEDVHLSKGEIYVPYTMQPTVDTDDILVLKINGKDYEFKVKGFSENPLCCSNVSMSLNYVYISRTDYEEIESRSSGKVTSDILLSDLYKCKTDDKVTDLDALQQRISDVYNSYVSKSEETNTDTIFDIALIANKDLLLFGNTMMPYISIGFITIFAVMILVIALIIISFSISNFIQRNMKNTGILEACGYRVSELKNALTVQIMSVTIVGTAAGLLLALLSLPSMGEVLIMVMGITWTSKTDYLPLVITGAALLLIVFLTTRILSRKYNRISVLDALRGGISSHNFKKNRFAFSKTRLPIALVLSLKETFGSIGKNIALAIIISILTVSAIIGFSLQENFSSDKNGMLDVMGFEMGTAGVTAIAGIGDELRALPGVTNVYDCQTKVLTLEYGGKSYIFDTYGVAEPEYAIKTVVTEGRQPESDNEVMLTNPVAMQTGAGVGDVVTIKNGDRSEEFIVTGINQRLEQAGRTLAMTLDGFDRLGARSDYDSYYITVEDGITYDEIKKTLEDYGRSKGIELGITNTGELIEGTISGMVSTFDTVNVLILIVTAFIVIFVESLVIRAKITREWRSMGINKALGMTSGNLIGQIALSNFPVILTGCVLGALSSGFVGRTLMIVIFSYMGIQKINLTTPVLKILASVVVIILVAVITSALEGLKIRKLIPMEMITEE